MKQLDIFGNETDCADPPKRGRRYKRMQEINGLLPGKTCGTCKHCVGYRQSRTWYKCELWIVSASSATDIRKKNTACRRGESAE